MAIQSRSCLNEELEIGDDSRLGDSIHLDCTAPIVIGKRCLIGHGVTIITAQHSIDLSPVSRTHSSGGPVIIEDDVWIAANTMILPGITIGKGSAIGAGSLVTKSIPENVLAVGSPARIVRKINQSPERQKS